MTGLVDYRNDRKVVEVLEINKIRRKNDKDGRKSIKIRTIDWHNKKVKFDQKTTRLAEKSQK